MKEPKAYGRTKRTITFKGRSAAPPEVVYDVLADLRSHLEWGGKRQYKMCRLLELDAPPGPANEGTVYKSVGTIPMMSARWNNTTTVTEAQRPKVASRGRSKPPAKEPSSTDSRSRPTVGAAASCTAPISFGSSTHRGV